MNEKSTPLPSGSRIIPLNTPKQSYMFFQYHSGIIAVTLEKVDDDNQEMKCFGVQTNISSDNRLFQVVEVWVNDGTLSFGILDLIQGTNVLLT